MSADELKRLDGFTKLYPPRFISASSEEAQDFMDRCHEFLHNMGIVEPNRVAFTVFQMHSSAKRIWQVYEQGRRVGSPSLTWTKFLKFFLEKFIPFTQ